MSDGAPTERIDPPGPKDRTCTRCLQPRCDQFTMVCQRCQDAEAYALAEKRMKELRDGY